MLSQIWRPHRHMWNVAIFMEHISVKTDKQKSKNNVPKQCSKYTAFKTEEFLALLLRKFSSLKREKVQERLVIGRR